MRKLIIALVLAGLMMVATATAAFATSGGGGGQRPSPVSPEPLDSYIQLCLLMRPQMRFPISGGDSILSVGGGGKDDQGAFVNMVQHGALTVG